MPPAGAGWDPEGAGDIGRDPGIGVEVPVEDRCFFLCFFLDSVSLDSERFGEPGLFRVLDFFKASMCFGRPEGVFVPFEEVPEGALFFSASLAFSFAASSFFLSISFCFSSSEVSSSLYKWLAKNHIVKEMPFAYR